MPCGTCRAALRATGLGLVDWATSGSVAHVVCRGYPGSYPPQLVPERLVSVVQRRLELVRAGANKDKQPNSWSDHRDELSSSCEQLPSSLNQVRLAIRV